MARKQLFGNFLFSNIKNQTFYILLSLLDAVFSNYDYSGAVINDAKPTLERMSYYTLYKQIVNSRDDKSEQLKLEIQAKEVE